MDEDKQITPASTTPTVAAETTPPVAAPSATTKAFMGSLDSTEGSEAFRGLVRGKRAHALVVAQDVDGAVTTARDLAKRYSAVLLDLTHVEEAARGAAYAAAVKLINDVTGTGDGSQFLVTALRDAKDMSTLAAVNAQTAIVHVAPQTDGGDVVGLHFIAEDEAMLGTHPDIRRGHRERSHRALSKREA